MLYQVFRYNGLLGDQHEHQITKRCPHGSRPTDQSSVPLKVKMYEQYCKKILFKCCYS